MNAKLRNDNHQLESDPLLSPMCSERTDRMPQCPEVFFSKTGPSPMSQLLLRVAELAFVVVGTYKLLQFSNSFVVFLAGPKHCDGKFDWVGLVLSCGRCQAV